MENTFFVTLNTQEALNVINQAVVGGSITGECIDNYTIAGQDGKGCIVSVYEKHYYRTGNRLTLTVVLDNFEGLTRVHCISGGGGGLLNFDMGCFRELFLYCLGLPGRIPGGIEQKAIIKQR